MEYRTLGRTGLSVSLVSLGSGGPSQLGQNTSVPESEVHTLLHTALDMGINLIDTAAGYGKSEEILGRALKTVDRNRYYIATKTRPVSASRPTDCTSRAQGSCCPYRGNKLGCKLSMTGSLFVMRVSVESSSDRSLGVISIPALLAGGITTQTTEPSAIVGGGPSNGTHSLTLNLLVSKSPLDAHKSMLLDRRMSNDSSSACTKTIVG